MTFPPILFNDFQCEPEQLIQVQLQAMEAVLRSGWWVLGQQVKAFEQAWALRCSTAASVGVANGLDAIEIGLRALGIGIGDEVITTPMTAFATTLAIQRCGATPVFADIIPSTGCLDPDSVERCISPSTRAVLVVHLYGRAADLASLSSLCTNYRLALVEDCAQAHGAQYHGSPVGSIGTLGAWSFYPTKNLGAIGDAGALTSNDPDIISAAVQLRNYGQSNRYYHVSAGLNSRLDELQAAILLQRLPYLQSWIERRRAIADRYWNEIDNPLLEALDKPSDPFSHVHHLFVMRSSVRDQLIDYLQMKGIHAFIHYPVSSHMQTALSHYRMTDTGVPHAVYHASTCFSLPTSPYLSDEQVDRIVAECNDFA